MIQEERLVKLFKEMCLINAPSLQEGKVADYVETFLKANEIEVWRDGGAVRMGGTCDNLIAKLPGNTPGAPKIFLSAHMDTVEPTEGLTILEEDGIFKSDGTTILGADDKGGLASAIEAALCVKEHNLPHGDLYLLISCAEEIGLKGAAALKIEELGLDFGYVLDTGPPVGTFVTKVATKDSLNIEVIGKPAHAGKEPEKGINAMVVASKAISQMSIGRIDEETVANLGVISGGTGTNVVCASVTIRAEARSMDIEKLDKQVDHMVTCFVKAADEAGAEVKICHERDYSGYEMPENEKVVKIAQRASSKLGFTPNLRTTLGGSDANIYNAKGVPTIVVATGMDKIHTHEELISRKDLIDATRLAIELIVESAS